ncbi:hypothetical protein Y1Q_0012963 [Alligator mississippiensis]|nr:hypothetical protein Y1Q_0012963 [Alligator mississippiensis]
MGASRRPPPARPRQLRDLDERGDSGEAMERSGLGWCSRCWRGRLMAVGRSHGLSSRWPGLEQEAGLSAPQQAALGRGARSSPWRVGFGAQGKEDAVTVPVAQGQEQTQQPPATVGRDGDVALTPRPRSLDSSPRVMDAGLLLQFRKSLLSFGL